MHEVASQTTARSHAAGLMGFGAFASGGHDAGACATQEVVVSVKNTFLDAEILKPTIDALDGRSSPGLATAGRIINIK